MGRRSFAIAGYGTIGKKVAQVVREKLPQFELVAISGSTIERARIAAETLSGVEAVESQDIWKSAEVVVECVPTEAFLGVAAPAIENGRTLVTVSSAALLDNWQLVTRAEKTGARIILATGALLGLDAVRAAAFGKIESVVMLTRKPPQSLATAKYVVENGINLSDLRQPVRLFEGSAREGARAFPANVNVAASLGLAGIGPDRTRLEIWADPDLTRNTHIITVVADSARFEMRIENVPSAEKPGTGRITALSVVAALDSLTNPLRVGT